MFYKLGDIFTDLEDGNRGRAVRRLNMMELNTRKANNDFAFLFRDLKSLVKKGRRR